ncbi:MAG: hypothetical protein JSW52_05175 [Candidatus Coatesbacteria bacterium]|nr:MAG: hypothetical protein JSW52_05175 [Candidatus Coatesbacteria bacterium]
MARRKLDDRIRDDFGEFKGVVFEKTRLELGKRPDGTPIVYEFDLVSRDRKIIGVIKTNRLRLSTRPKKAYGSVYSVLGAVLYLHKYPEAKERYVILSDREMYEEVVNRLGDTCKDIEILYWGDIKKGS